MKSEEFLEPVRVDIGGTFHVAQAFLLNASSNATVIDVNSGGAHVNFMSGFAVYNINKLAVFRLWDSVSFENPNLSVFHLQPGIVDTEMNREAGGIQAIDIEDHGK